MFSFKIAVVIFKLNLKPPVTKIMKCETIMQNSFKIYTKDINLTMVRIIIGAEPWSD